MMRGRLFLAPEHRRFLDAAARGAMPEECCGVLLGRRPAADVGVVTRVIETENASRRSRESRYEIAPRDVVAAWRRGRATGEVILGFYHSHPGGAGRPSSRDALAAWTGMSYVIVAPDGGACALTSWRRERDGRGLAREEILAVRPGEIGA